MRRLIVPGLVAATTWIAGCDKPAPPATVPAVSSADARPATRNATRVLHLAPYPLRITVPESWSILNTGDVMFVQGPTSDGDAIEHMARVQVSSPPAISAASAERLAADHAAGKPLDGETTIKIDVRTSGNVRILEKRARQTLSDGSEVLVNWSLDLLVPEPSGRVLLYHLNFVALTQARYEKERETLEKIMASVAYDPSLLAAPK